MYLFCFYVFEHLPQWFTNLQNDEQLDIALTLIVFKNDENAVNLLLENKYGLLKENIAQLMKIRSSVILFAHT